MVRLVSFLFVLIEIEINRAFFTFISIQLNKGNEWTEGREMCLIVNEVKISEWSERMLHSL